MVSTVTSAAPTLSRNRKASSSAKRSYGLITDGTPWRMMVFVTGCTRICALSGTCLRQTTICILVLIMLTLAIRRGRKLNQRCRGRLHRVFEHFKYALFEGSRLDEVAVCALEMRSAQRARGLLVGFRQRALVFAQIVAHPFEDVQPHDVEHRRIVSDVQEGEEILS